MEQLQAMKKRAMSELKRLNDLEDESTFTGKLYMLDYVEIKRKHANDNLDKINLLISCKKK